MNVSKPRVLLLAAFSFVCLLFFFFICSEKPSAANVFPVQPVQSTSSEPFMFSFQYTVPNDSRFVLNFETWTMGTMTAKEEIAEFSNHSGTFHLQLVPFKNKLCYTIQTASAINNIEKEISSGFVYASLSYNEWVENYSSGSLDDSDGIILLCVGFGNLDVGIPAIDCISPMDNVLFLGRYNEVHIIRGEVYA